MPPPTSGRDKHTPQLVVAQRVAAVAGFLLRGATRAEVRQTVATAQTTEASTRRAARKAAIERGTAADVALAASSDGGVPILWGDDPIAERTLDRYIEKAKEQIVDDGLGAIEDLEAEVGRLYSRQLAVFHAAFRDKRYHAANQALDQLARWLGAEEVAKLIRPDLEGEDAAGGGVNLPLVRVEATGPAIPDDRRKALGLVK